MKPLPILAFLIAAAIGWNVAGNVSPPRRSAAVSAAPVRTTARAERQARRHGGPDEVSAQQLAAIRASRDPSARMRATVDLARSLSPEEFAAWTDGGWFDISGGAELTLFTKILQERWELEDPEGLVVWAMKNDSGRGEKILADWAKTDPQRALDFFRNHPDPGREVQTLASIAQVNPTLALQRLLEITADGLADPRNGMSYSNMLLQEIAKRAPAELEAALGSLPGELRLDAEGLLIAGRLKDSPTAELEKLLERRDGPELFNRMMRSGNSDAPEFEAVRAHLLENLADLPASWRAGISQNSYGFISQKNAEQWATVDLEGAGFSAEESQRIRISALGRLYRQPEVALKLLAGMEMEENYRRNIISNIFNNLQEENADKATTLAAMLTDEEDRKFALAQTAGRTASQEPAEIKSPESWLAGLAALDAKSGSLSYNYIVAAREWDQGQRDELVRQFRALPEEARRTVAENSVRNNYGESSPLDAEAIRFLIAHPTPDPEAPKRENEPPDIREIQAAARYVGSLAQKDPTAAGDWIATLPAGQPKLWAQKNLLSIWSQYDSEGADQWLASQPAADREAIKELVKNPR